MSVNFAGALSDDTLTVTEGGLASDAGSGAFSGGVTLAKQFGKTKPATVVLKRGVDQDMTLWSWHADALAGKPDARRGATLMLKDSAGGTQQSYVLHMAWPSKLELGGFKAGGSEAIIATVTLTCEMIEVSPGGTL